MIPRADGSWTGVFSPRKYGSTATPPEPGGAASARASNSGSSAVGHGGLGYSSVYALNQLDTPYLFTLVLASSVMGLAFFFLVAAIERLVLRHWHESVIHDLAD